MASLRIAQHSCRLFWVLVIFDDWPCFLSHVKCMVCVDLFFVKGGLGEDGDG